MSNNKSEPMPHPFPRHYGEHIIPRLRRLVAAEAVCVVRGVETFAGGHDSLLAYARRYGGLYLPMEAFQALEDWLSVTLLEEIIRQESCPAADAL